MERLYTAAECRELDRLAIEEHGIPGFELMLRAGRAAFAELLQRWPEVRSISVCCGKGNNAGDGYVIAGLAREIGVAVELVQLGDAATLTGDAGRARDWALERGVQPLPGPTEELRGDVVVDALLGTGISGELRPGFRELVHTINSNERPVLAVDVPTGVNADTGAAGEPAVRADVTVTFIGRKIGLFTGPGASLAGDVVYAGLGVPSQVLNAVPGCRWLRYGELPGLPPRDRNAYKQALGHVLVVGGDSGMGGAVLMAGETALRVGAGLVSLATRGAHRPAALARRPELMVGDADDSDTVTALIERASTLVVGPGLGREAWGRRLMERALATGKPAVVDADALYFLAEGSASGAGPMVVTPHSGEAARLLGVGSAAVQNDRIGAARQLAAQVRGVAVLKGAGTVIAEWLGPGRDVVVRGVCAHGNPGMASAGMGDVLSGAIGGLLAQGLSPGPAAELGVCLHSLAADRAVEQMGQRGLLATDLIPEMVELLREPGPDAGSGR